VRVSDHSSARPPSAATSLRPGKDGGSPSPGGSRARGLTATVVVVAALVALALLNRWLLSVTLILGCGVCVAFEFALVKVSTRELERSAEAGVPGAVILLEMKSQVNALLAACQFGITLSSLGLTLALEPAIHHVLERYEGVAKYSAALAMALGAFLHVTFGELIPKGLALVVPTKVLLITAPFMRMFRIAAVPFIKTCNTIANLGVYLLTEKHPDRDAHQEEDVDVDEALIAAHSTGKLKPEQLQLMRNVLSFADRTVREAMTPARQVVYLDLKRSWEDNMKLAEEHGFSRLPVIDGNPHDVVGYARRADLLKAEIRQKRDLAPLVRPIERRPETATLARLNLFQGSPMIAVYDEHDSHTGVLTAEDIVEQIVGEIYDETDEPAKSEVEQLEGGAIRMQGSVLRESAAEYLGVPDLDEHSDVDTIGGVILKVLGRQPKVGDEVDVHGYRALVEEARGFRILSLLFTPLADAPAEDGATPPSE
jgi:CBS domain containing-hemolysin-like protein